MREFFIALTIVLGVFSVTPASARGPCAPADPFATRFTGCPGQPMGRGFRPAPSYAVNRGTFAIRNPYPETGLNPRIRYNPPVHAGYGGGYGMARAASMQSERFTAMRMVRTVSHSVRTCTWHRSNGGPKVYDDPSCPPR